MSDASNFRLIPQSSKIAEFDHMSRQHLVHYFGVGLSAAWILKNVLSIRDARLVSPAPVARVLDFGSGAGRVARFLRTLLPDAEVQVSDWRHRDVAWCVENLGCVAAPEPLPDRTYDLIWLGSVFTHLPEAAAKELLARLLATLAPNGVLAFSSQGRYSATRLRTVNEEAAIKAPWLRYNLSAAATSTLLEAYDNTGYGYVGYPNQTGYGVSVVDPAWYTRTVFNLGDFSQIYLAERDFDDHQDVQAFMARPLLGTRTTRFTELAKRIAEAAPGA